jgi:Ca2+-binding RTX toxin-like protein
MAVVGSVLVVAFAGVAFAAGVINCTGGRCEGTNRNDTFVGTNRVDLILAKDGEDRAGANGGADELRGGNDDDTLFGEAGNDTYFGGKGRDFLGEFERPSAGTDDDGNDVMNGGDGPDRMSGGREADILNGQDASDVLFGNPGNDELRGGPGPDEMAGDRDRDKHFGGTGDDFIDAVQDDSPEDPADLVVCGPGIDEAVVRPHDVVHKGCENVEVRE